MINMEPHMAFAYDMDNGVALCVIENQYGVYHGHATCMEQDRDMMSENTGKEIAAHRAMIDYFKGVRDNYLNPRLGVLNQLYYSMNRSQFFNENSYETKMLKSQIRSLENDLAIVKEELANEKQMLKDYIENKEKIYKYIRDKRKAENK